ncbi:MAG: hypothetical protein K2J20_02310 [Bacilli bacterium]|nr:hypothetical protein [Bacilli bacterium]
MPNFDLREKSNYQFIVINMKNMYSFSKINMCSLLRTIMHEIKHAMNTVINAYHTDGIHAWCYTGLLKREYSNKKSFEYLEEAFNSFMTCLYASCIMDLAELDVEIEDGEIDRILGEFEMWYYKPLSYECANLLVPLFEDEDFFRLFYNATLYKDFEPLISTLQQHYKIKEITELDKDLARYEKGLSHEILDFFRIKNKGYPKSRLRINSYYHNMN